MRLNYIIVFGLIAASCAVEQAGPGYEAVGQLHLPGGAWEPVAVAVGAEGRVYVADASEHSAIQVFSAEGLYLGGFGGPGEAAGDTLVPWDVAVGPDEAIYVAEFGTRRLSVFDPSGSLQRIVGVGDLVAPFGVAAARDGNIYAADPEAKGVFQFSPEGKLLGPATTDPRLARGWDVAAGANGRLAAATPEAVFVWRGAGEEPRSIPLGTENATVPYEVAFGPEGELFVLARKTSAGETEEPYLFRFTRGGRLREEIELDLTSPTGLAVAPDGTIYVADGPRRTVKKYRPR
ncbi:MAG: NHL repeat-containing protein [Candidatus Coatesbacteria bacterium]|nr:MAG: NHL repeat-containing protein [Candidatus Coatesbacteria bacterium]